MVMQEEREREFVRCRQKVVYVSSQKGGKENATSKRKTSPRLAPPSRFLSHQDTPQPSSDSPVLTPFALISSVTSFPVPVPMAMTVMARRADLPPPTPICSALSAAYED